MIAVTASVSEQAENRWKRRMDKYAEFPSLGGWDVIRNYPQNDGMVAAYQDEYESERERSSIIAFTHDDWEPHELWAGRIEAEFYDPKVAIVGMGGAKGIGLPEIYKVPYEIHQLQRIGYRSNQTDWEIHGLRETGACDVAVVDGFFMAVRTAFLDEIGGWKFFPYQFHCYDLALCLEAHGRGWKVRMVGVKCTHHGGGTSTTPEYVQQCKDRGTTPEREHQEPHKWLYHRYPDVLPMRVR